MSRSPQARVHPSLLVWARKSVGLELDEAANRIRVEVERLEAWESGEQSLSISQLRDCAHAYQRPLAVFFLPEPPRDFSVPHDYRLVAGRVHVGLSPEALSEIRRIQFQREVALELAEPGEAEEVEFLGTETLGADFEAAGVRFRARAGINAAIRKSWGSPRKALNWWRDGIERLGVLVFHFENCAVDEIRGFSIAAPRLPIVAVNGQDSPAGRVFTLLHEVGHLLLNLGGTCDLVEDRSPGAQDRAVERYCNSFAAACLMPRGEVQKFFQLSANPDARAWSDDAISKGAGAFCVSPEAMLRRLVDLGAATFPFYLAARLRYQRQYAEAEAARCAKRGAGGPPQSRMAIRRTGPAFARIAFHAYDRDSITTNELSEYLGVRTKHFEKIRKLAFSTAANRDDN